MSDFEPRSKPSSSELLNNIGPILAAAFDKGFSAFIREWPLFAASGVISLALGFINGALGLIPPLIVLLYWIYRAFANAARLFDTTYQMNFGGIIRLICLAFVNAVAVVIGFLLLVVPGVWLANKLSLVLVASLRHDRDFLDAVRESWDLTTGRFWETVLFNVVVNIAGSAVAIVAELFATIALAVFGLAQNPDKADQLPTGWLGMIFALAFALYFYAVAFAQQAIIMCQRLWLAALRGEPLPVRSPAPVELLP